jgi:uncharacterized protein YjbI with pentapeptide repeats
MSTRRQIESRWEEPAGKVIFDRIVSLGIIQKGHGRTADDVFRALDGLPFRDEIDNGRDFRGVNFAARDLELSNCNFTYAQIAHFYFCILAGSIFDQCTAERATFHSDLTACSFARSKLRSCYFNDSLAPNCNFSNARMRGCNFQRTDLRGSTFRDTDCRGASFAGVNIIDCSFNGADLQGAVFCDVVLDKSTDFRGANITGIFTHDWHDRNGNLTRKGMDINQATT